jgi:lysozyme
MKKLTASAGVCSIGLILGIVFGMPDSGLRTSPAGMELVTDFEGCRLDAYKCPGNVWTTGVGHTVSARPGQVLSHEQVAENLVTDVAGAEHIVNRHVRVPLSQGQFDALVSFAFNVGEGNFRSSTLLRKLNAGDYAGACHQLPRWVYSGGQKLAGLERRRLAERDLCLEGVTQ